jgi:hypothetical protein
MARYDAEGCFLTDPAYYASLAERYGIFQAELDTFQRAAVAVGQNEAYSRYLLLIYVFLTEVPFTKAELKAFRILPTDDASDFALDMLPGLALYGQFPRCYENLKNRGLPEAMIRDLMARPERTVAGFRKLHNGAEGFHLFKWYQRLIRGDIYDIGCLQVELHIPFTNQACLFRSLDGQHVALARECKLHFREQKYAEAEQLLSQGDYQGAYDIFKGIGGYSDAEIRATEIADKYGIVVSTPDPFAEPVIPLE